MPAPRSADDADDPPPPTLDAGGAWRLLVDAIDRRLHPRRRAAAVRRLKRMGMPARVLFVCEGNIYRSPFAAGAFLRALPAPVRERMQVSSAGFAVSGRPAPAEAVASAARRGVDLGAHRSSIVTAARVAQADLVVAMEPRQRRLLLERYRASSARVLVLGDLDPLPIASRAVADPLGGDPAVLEPAYDRVERCARMLAMTLAPAR